MRSVLALSLLLAIVACGVAEAQDDVGLGNLYRRTLVAVGANYEWYSPEGTVAAPATDKEWSFGAYGSYNVVPKLSMVGYSAYMTDNQHIRTGFGGNYNFYKGPFDLGLGVIYEWTYASGDEPVQDPGKEWNTALRGTMPLNRWLVAAGSASYGMDTKVIRSSLGLRAVVHQPH